MAQTLLEFLAALCNKKLMENKTGNDQNIKKKSALWIDLSTAEQSKKNEEKSEVKALLEENSVEQAQKTAAQEQKKLEKEKQERIDQTYQKMIEILNYVFKDLTGESYAYEYDYSIKNYKKRISLKSLERRYLDIVDDLNADMHRCTTMYRYIVMAYALDSSADISKLYDDLLTQFNSFNRYFPLYPYQIFPEDDSADQEHHNYRRTSETKREQLHNLYAKAFKDINEHPQHEILIKGFCAGSEMEALHEIAGYSATDTRELLSESSLKTLTEAYQKLSKKYMERMGEAGVQYYKLAEYVQNANSTLTENEVSFIQFLFSLYDKYLNLEDPVDLRNPENSQKWDLITAEDQQILLKHLRLLNDRKQTYLKYVGGFLRNTTEDRYQRLVANLSGDYFYETEYLANCILKTCRRMSNYASNYEDKRYQQIAESVRRAYEDCLKIEPKPQCFTEQQFKSEVERAGKELLEKKKQREASADKRTEIDFLNSGWSFFTQPTK